MDNEKKIMITLKGEEVHVEGYNLPDTVEVLDLLIKSISGLIFKTANKGKIEEATELVCSTIKEMVNDVRVEKIK